MDINTRNVHLVKEHVKRLLSIVNMYRHFTDSFIIEFFVEDHWSKVNQRWKKVFEQMEPSDFSNEIFQTKPHRGYSTVLPLSLLAFKSCCLHLGLSRDYDHSADEGEFNVLRCQSKMIDHIFRKHVKPKKQHEIRKLVDIILNEAEQSEVMRVVDVGSGHGHLSRFLSIGHEIPVSSFELNAKSVAAAKQFDKECIKCAFKKQPSGPKVVPSHNACYIEPFISSCNFMKLFQNVELNTRLLLTGLHACGDLSATMIHTFVNCHEVKALVSVSCCYMKLSTPEDTGSKNTVYGYPMSSYVNSLPVKMRYLSYQSRAIACHANEVFSTKLLTNGNDLRVHCCRSIVENLIRESCPELIRPGVRISQEIQLNNFERYVKIAFDRLGIPAPSLEKIHGENVTSMHSQWRRVVMYYALSLLLAPLVETIVLLDRDLLRFAVAAGSHGKNDDAPNDNLNADRAWLQEAIHDYATLAVNPVDCMKNHLSRIHQFLHPTNEGIGMEVSDVHHALSEIAEYCEDFDLAADFHRIGGFDVLIQCLQSSDIKMLELSCKVLGAACQNHKYCQDTLIEMNVLPILINLIEKPALDNEDSVRITAFFALSCLVRGNASAMTCFQNSDGFSLIPKLIRSNSRRLKLKVMFFIKSVCKEDPKYAKYFHECKVEIQIVAFLNALVCNWCDNQDATYDATVEDILDCFITLVTTCEEAKAECSNHSQGLVPLLQKLKKWCISNEGTEDCVERCDKLLELCCLGDQEYDR